MQAAFFSYIKQTNCCSKSACEADLIAQDKVGDFVEEAGELLHELG
jgi:hypothetical protein